MIDATSLKVHHTASNLRAENGGERSDWLSFRAHEGRAYHPFYCRHRGDGRPLRFFMTAGQGSEFSGADIFWALYLLNGLSPNGAMMPIGSGKRLKLME